MPPWKCRISALLLVLAFGGCDATVGEGEEGSYGDSEFSLGANAKVEDAVYGACSTTAVYGLSEQLVEELNCISPGTMARIDDIPGLSLSAAVFPWLSSPARDGLARAAARRSRTMYVNSALRTTVQQYLLYRWYLAGRCGIGIAARPGTSNHESGRAVDISYYSSWRYSMEIEGWSWLGSFDPVHFDYFAAPDVSSRSVLAFQRLWNRNNPQDRIAEDGYYGAQTEVRIARSPADGFPIGASCEQQEDLAPIEVYWSRQADGGYRLRALPWDGNVTRIEYYTDGVQIGEATMADGANFPDLYYYMYEGPEREFEARGFDSNGVQIARGVGMLDVTDGVGVYIKQMGKDLYEIGLERAPAGVAAIEVRADGYLLTDSVSDTSRSARNAVRSKFFTLGERNFQITTFNADCSERGNLYRTFTLQ